MRSLLERRPCGTKRKSFGIAGACCLRLAEARSAPRSKAGLGVANKEADRENIRAAIDAIESGNHNFFVNRDHSGKMTLTIS